MGLHSLRGLLLCPAIVAAAVVGVCGPGAPAAALPHPPPDGGHKVMIIVEENHSYEQIIGSPAAPYLNRLAAEYGTASDYDAGYPARCPSLAAYILLTSGTTAGICDDRDPKNHRLAGTNVFHQVTTAGRQWRDYAETAPEDCALVSHGRYLVRHVPATYYLDERTDCRRWTVPLSPALPGDVAAGRLPALSFVSPDACHDMHGTTSCPANLIENGDRWLSAWLPTIMAGPDYRAGRLTVIVTWDEGTSATNHIPTLVIAPTIRHRTLTGPLSHCSTLRFTELQLHLPLLRCAATAAALA